MLEACNTTVAPPSRRSTRLTSNAGDGDTSVPLAADAKGNDDGEQHGKARKRHENARTTASNVEYHGNARTVPRMMAMEINVDNTNTRTTTVVKVPPLSVVSSESVVAIVPNHVEKVFFFFLCACRCIY